MKKKSFNISYHFKIFLQVFLSVALFYYASSTLAKETNEIFIDVEQLSLDYTNLKQKIELARNINYYDYRLLLRKTGQIKEQSKQCINFFKNSLEETQHLLNSHLSKDNQLQLSADYDKQIKYLKDCELTHYKTIQLYHDISFLRIHSTSTPFMYVKWPAISELTFEKIRTATIEINPVEKTQTFKMIMNNRYEFFLLGIVESCIIFFIILSARRIKTRGHGLKHFISKNSVLIVAFANNLILFLFMNLKSHLSYERPFILKLIFISLSMFLLLILDKTYLFYFKKTNNIRTLLRRKKVYLFLEYLFIFNLIRLTVYFGLFFFKLNPLIEIINFSTLIIFSTILYFIGLSAIRVLLDPKLYSLKVQKNLPFYKACLQITLLGICASKISLGFVGYLRLGYILDIMIAFGIGLIMVLYILISFLNYLSHSLQRPTKDGFKGSIYRFLDLEKNRRFFEIPLLFFLLSISIIIIFFVPVMINVWQLPAKFRFIMGDILLGGYKFGQLEFNFPTLFYSSFSLLFMSILGRISGGLFIHMSQKKLDLTQKEIIKKMFRFVFLFLGTLISMDIIGFDIKSVSVIIGAFSVGIGFGLKNVASDIIAGINIMFQKNFGLKDHIEVNGIEGYIEKINLFTTEIRTLDNTNLIIPNSTITNSSVVNHTFQNNLWTSSLQFIISDLDKLELAKKIILQSLKKFPEIITKEPHNPEVLLQSIKVNGNTIPCLVVRFSLKNQEKYPKASSQLNYEIVKAFKLNDIFLNK